MDEQQNKVPEKQVHKTQNTVKSVFRWLFVGVLVVLLVAALIFQAPWKVIALLVVFLLACTALPGPFRKWFWLSVGVVVIVLIVWVFLPENNEGWQPYTFDEELAALEAKYAVPPDKNAATIYNELLENYDPNAFYANLPKDERWKLPMREPWLSKEEPQIAEWVQQHQTTMATLLRASKIDKCRFPIGADPFGYRRTRERLRAMRHWAMLLVFAANNDVGDGRINQALEKYTAVLKMGEHLYQQPAMIGTLVGTAVEALAIQNLNRFIATDSATETRLNFIEETLRAIKRDWSADLPESLECQKLFDKNTWGMAYEINPKGKVRLTRDPIAAIRAEFPRKVPPLPYWEERRLKANTVLNWFSMPSTPQKMSDIIDSSYEKLYAMAELDYDWQKEPKAISIRSLFSFPVRFCYGRMIRLATGIEEEALHELHDLYIMGTTQRRGTLIVVALQRYKNRNGAWPDSPDDIKGLTSPEVFIDPINSGSFVYKPTDNSFTLYSKGKNNIDEGGERDRKSGADDWPVWPPRHRKTKKENDDAE